MEFYKVYVENAMDQHTVIERIAVRAVIYHQNKILLVHSILGDYKFPGGGVKEEESHVEGLIREVREETGYVHFNVKNKIGTVVERKMDDYDSEAIFQMTSHYYVCELLSEARVDQQLDHYEAEQKFSPEWVSIDEAIEQNEKIMGRVDKNDWLERETFVLKELKGFEVKEYGA